MFGRGDLKYALLDLLRERPKHGYEMIKELEDRSGGFYTPSAGAVYPTLQLLEDRGWVTVETRDGKKVYQMTDAGKSALAEHHEPGEAFAGPRFWREHGPRGPRGPIPHGPHGPEGPGGPEGGPWGGGFGFWRDLRPELRALRHEGMEVARLMRAAVMASGGDPERLARLRAIVERTRADLDTFLGQGPGSSGTQPTPPAGGPVENL
jgi:DNA-binding PadR family transcriptional regulator